MEAAMLVYGLFAGLIVLILVVIFVAAGVSAIVRGIRRHRLDQTRQPPPS
ncbi:MAG: hypothetical protein ACREQD_04705 [Candidatus Binataceae bacterium]